jgi:trehalose/maltose transport system permease protein
MSQNTGPLLIPEAAKSELASPKGAGGISAMARERERLAWILLSPTILVIVFVALWPLLQTIVYSFTDARLGSARAIHFVGLRNYIDLLTDTRFLSSILLTVKFALVTVVFEFGLGLIIALVINSNFKGRGVMRAAILVPWAIPTVMSTQMWKWMYHDVFGVVNDLGLRLHLIARPVAWVADPAVIFPAVCAIDIWKATPFIALMLLAGLQVIPADIYEAADIDGATPLQQFWKLTLPMLRPAILVTLIFRTLDALRAFDIFYVMVGNRPRFQSMAVFNQQILVEFSKVGLGSAVSVIIFALIALFVFIYMKFLNVQEA